MAFQVEREVAGINFVIRELTLDEIRCWMKSMGDEKIDAVAANLIDDENINDLRVLTTLSDADLGAMTPTELRRVFELVKEVNADFFAMRQRVADLSRRLLSGISKTPLQG